MHEGIIVGFFLMLITVASSGGAIFLEKNKNKQMNSPTKSQKEDFSEQNFTQHLNINSKSENKNKAALDPKLKTFKKESKESSESQINKHSEDNQESGAYKTGLSACETVENFGAGIYDGAKKMVGNSTKRVYNDAKNLASVPLNFVLNHGGNYVINKAIEAKNWVMDKYNHIYEWWNKGKNAGAPAANAAPGPNLPPNTNSNPKKALIIGGSQEFEKVKTGHRTVTSVSLGSSTNHSSNEKSTPANQTGCGIA